MLGLCQQEQRLDLGRHVVIACRKRRLIFKIRHRAKAPDHGARAGLARDVHRRPGAAEHADVG